MRCPKCQYISFDSGERCRNCGYEFSLVAAEAPVDVNIARDEPSSGRVRDTSFSALDTPLSTDHSRGDSAGRQFGDARRPLTAADLPLFTDRLADDQAPLVTPPAVPRAPLSVRRTTPPRHRARSPLPEELSLDLADDPDNDAERPLALHEASPGTGSLPPVAGLVRRIGAGLVDVALLGAIGAAVVFLTLRLCALTLAEWRTLPAAPLAAFLLLLCGGYFVLFTAAGGQTIGKMATRIRVVNIPEAASGRLRVSFSTAVLRTIACLGSVAAAGTGFLPVLFSDDRRAFHDRVAETRVVPA